MNAVLAVILDPYMASSAAWISPSAEAATSGSVATPTDTVRWMFEPSPAGNVRGDALAHALADGGRAFAAGVGQNQRELVAAEPRDHVGLAGAARG